MNMSVPAQMRGLNEGRMPITCMALRTEASQDAFQGLTAAGD